MRHSGTGRFAWLTMRTMSLWESGESNGTVSMEELFLQPQMIFSESTLQLEEIAFLICRGGWPFSVGLDSKYALRQAYAYFDAVVENDIVRIDNSLKNSSRARRIMRSLARHQGTQTPVTTICSDSKMNESEALAEETVSLYINALKKIFVIEDAETWNPNLRSKTAIRTSNTRYFTDPSIAVAALGIGPQDLMNDLNTMGLLFETLAVRDLRVYAEVLDGNVFHFRDKTAWNAMPLCICETVIMVWWR